MSVFKKAMFYLGLGPDDAYDDEPLEPERPPVRCPAARAASYAGTDELVGHRAGHPGPPAGPGVVVAPAVAARDATCRP